ncbi:MAG: hypothetical protein Q8910_00940 [Bacteroidota bacterium]|nr:hypothetical protein [Bacteroidota bacterium]
MIAGETITKGQVVTTNNQGDLVVNGNLSPNPTLLSTGSLYGILMRIDASRALFIYMTNAYVLTINADNSISQGAACPISGNISGTVQAGSQVATLTPDGLSFLIYTASGTYNYLQVLTVSGTTISAGTTVSLNGNVTSCYLDRVDSTHVLVCSVGGAFSSIKMAIISGTTVSMGSGTLGLASTGMNTIMGVLDSSHAFYSLNGTVYTFTYSSDGSSFTAGGSIIDISAIFGTTPPTTYIVADAFNIYLLYAGGTGKGFYKLTFNAGYSSAFCSSYVPIPNKLIINATTPASIDANTYLLSAVAPDSFSMSVVTATVSGGVLELTAGGKIPLPIKGYGVGMCAYLDPIRILFGASASTGANFYNQVLRLLGKKVYAPSINYGIAMNDAIAGNTVNVLVDGSSQAIYTDLIPGALYANFNGTLAPCGDRKSIQAPAPFMVTSGSSSTIPPFDLEQYDFDPYAVALSSTEIQIIDPLSSKGCVS